ncbi:class I SAM-dependent methyltransferase [Alteromonas ponticola]|uniref:Class I SAM-dependent methyltransferase n=1 Tax=Alteromonas ponticola TaxID=2720613 RepID=A0ABX1R5T4_9ALTE|nr:class I SAM-dependent methyltransferase [Alteromonas ponticola]NMH60610.1 class I SAM-dependent methyltransferase [Alteromonas ponticola]
MSTHTCPLCETDNTDFYYKDKKRAYWKCQHCDLVFVEKTALPSTSAELSEYQLHENNADDDGYKNFLSRLAIPLLSILAPQQRGLDFGCGPSPVLAQLLDEAGHQMTVYDPFFEPDESALEGNYDFITCTEAIEHFHQPRNELDLLNRLLKRKGYLAIMTKRVIDKTRFANWHYKNDPTHVSFFSDKTFAFIAQSWGYSLRLVSNDIVFMQKN